MENPDRQRILDLEARVLKLEAQTPQPDPGWSRAEQAMERTARNTSWILNYQLLRAAMPIIVIVVIILAMRGCNAS